MKENIIRWGVLSTAEIAQEQMIPAIQKVNNASVLAIASNSNKEIDVAKKFQIPKTYNTYEALLKDPEIDAVYIPLPNGLHANWSKEAAKHGKHILCEKPAALSEQEAQEVFKVCNEFNVQYMEALMYQFHPQHQRVKDIIASGEIGEMKLIRANFSFLLEQLEGNIRMDRSLGGGSLYDIGCYCIHIIRYITESEPIKCYSISKIHEHFNVDMSVVGMMELENGLPAYFDCAMDMPSRHMYEVVGTKGTIKVNKAFITQDDGQGEIIVQNHRGQNRQEIINGDSYANGIEHYSNCIINNTIPIHSTEDTIKNMRAIDAFLKTIDSGNIVEVKQNS